MANTLFDERDLIQKENHATRIPVVLCLDISGSMTHNGGIDALNEGVEAFFETCKDDPINRMGFDVAIVTFGANGVNKVQEFQPIWNKEDIPRFSFVAPTDGKNHGTPLAKGIDLSLLGLDQRIHEYEANCISKYQPFLVVITDGQSYMEDSSLIRQVQEKTVKLQRGKNLQVIAIGVGNQDYSELANFVVDKKVLLAKDFSSFDLVFEFMSRSMSSSSTTNVLADETDESPLTRIVEDLEDEGIVSISIEDFGRDED